MYIQFFSLHSPLSVSPSFQLSYPESVFIKLAIANGRLVCVLSSSRETVYSTRLDGCNFYILHCLNHDLFFVMISSFPESQAIYPELG